ncbi:hypothetical protein, partial [Pseudomonas edaphica]|uniref:hypothetical protein n=1 Tax=Pseudomonas edaphica TaxID=2006980 RepID=UPI00197EE3E2
SWLACDSNGECATAIAGKPAPTLTPLLQTIFRQPPLPEQPSQNRTILVRQPAHFPPVQPILVRFFSITLAERHSFAPKTLISGV